MNFTHLHYFLAAAEEQNITRAAKRLYISQQSLSAHIATLEKALNVRLFERTPAFALTYAGTRLEMFARRILDLERQIYSEMDDIAGCRRGALRVGISHTCGLAILPKILPLFCERNPLIEISILEGNSEELEDHLRHGRIDLMVVFTPVTLESVEIIPLAHERLLLLVPKKLFDERYGGKAVSLRDVFSRSVDISCFEGMPFILLKKGNRVRSLIDDYTEARCVKLDVVFETENTETAYALAQSGMGIAVYPELFLEHIHGADIHQSEGTDLFPITDEAVRGTLAACYERGRYLSNAARDFIEIARGTLQKKPEARPSSPAAPAGAAYPARQLDSD